METPAPPAPKPTVIYFCGPITHPATTRLRSALCLAVNIKVPNISIFMSSSGGNVDEGLALYGFIRSLPMTVTIHNIGVVDSIALAVYLAADVRVTNPDATFLVHDIFFTQPMPVTNRHQAADISAGLEGSRTRFMELLKLRTHMSDEQFEQFKFLDQLSIKSAVTAHETGIAHSVQQAVVPPGTELFNVEY